MDFAYLTSWHIVYIIVTIPIMLGNGLIIMSIIKYKSVRCTMHILIGNLAIADFMVGTILIPVDIACDLGGFCSNKYVCFFKLSLFVITLGSSCYSLLLISIERFVAIVYPLRVSQILTKTRLVFIIAIGWIYSLAIGTAPMYGWNLHGPNNTECVSDTLFTSEYKLMSNWMLISALVSNFVLYAIVMRIALKKAKASKVGAMVIHTKAERDLQQLVTMVFVLGTFAFCWFPYACMCVVTTFYETPYTQFIRRCTLLPGLFNSSINWIIFGYRNNKFRRAFRLLLRLKTTQVETSVSRTNFNTNG